MLTLLSVQDLGTNTIQQNAYPKTLKFGITDELRSNDVHNTMYF